VVSGGQTIGLLTVQVPIPAQLVITQQVIIPTNFYILATPSPTNLRTGLITQTSIEMEWTLPSSPVSNELVVASNHSLFLLGGNSTNLTIAGLQSSQTVSAYVAGVNYDLYGVFQTAPATNVIPVTGLQAPTGLTATSTAPGSLTLNWTQPGQLSGIWIVTNGTMSSFTATSNGTAYAAVESGWKSGAVITNTVYAHDATGNWKNATITGVVQ
jgi:hypothetical protein